MSCPAHRCSGPPSSEEGLVYSPSWRSRIERQSTGPQLPAEFRAWASRPEADSAGRNRVIRRTGWCGRVRLHCRTAGLRRQSDHRGFPIEPTVRARANTHPSGVPALGPLNELDDENHRDGQSQLTEPLADESVGVAAQLAEFESQELVAQQTRLKTKTLTMPPDSWRRS